MDDAVLDAFADWERAAWDQRASAYAAELGAITTGAAEALLDAAGVTAGTRVLDAGAGPGFVAEVALRRGAQVEAADQSPAMAAIAAERLPGLTVHCAPAERLGLADASYDAVVAGFLLNHLARPEVGIAELARVLALGGRLAMTVWATPAENRPMGLLTEVLADLGIRGSTPPGPDSLQFADEGRFSALLAGAGLKQVTVTRIRWDVDVAPGAWFDTVSRAMPRSGAVLASASPQERERARAAYVERFTADYPLAEGRARLPAMAVLGSGRRAG